MAASGNGNDGIQRTQPFSMRAIMPSDSEDLSSLFNQLLSPLPPPPPPGMDPNHSFSDPYAHHAYIPDTSHFLYNSNSNNTNTCDFTSPLEKNGEASDLPSSKPVPPSRTSSKRSRAAEFHNLSEKRRRSRINDKMKALQNLIPNSNKTDKASMLDEAIEYLKQLQLQVQMLMMRNGLSLHPMSLQGGLRPMILPQAGLNFDEVNGFQNSNSGIASSTNDERLVRPSYNFSKHCSFSRQSIVPPSMTNIATSHTSTIFQPYTKGERLRQTILDKVQATQLQSVKIIEAKILQKLDEKETELGSINKRNTELEDRMEQLSAEAGAWQQRARYNENMIAALKFNLQQVYLQSRDSREGCGDSEVDDTASCCNGRSIDFHLLSKDNIDMVCKACRVNEVSMLLLPCKHLCLCNDCESKLSFCPLCQSSKLIGMGVYM